MAENVETIIDKNYSPAILSSIDRNRHVPLSEAYSLVDSQDSSRLPVDKLKNAVEVGSIHVYQFGEESYLDRLDIGRVYHEANPNPKGIRIERYFSKEGEDPLMSAGPYGSETLEIKRVDGSIVYKLEGAEFPASWEGDDISKQIVAQKYFFSPRDSKWKKNLTDKIGRDHEHSVSHLITRVTNFFVDKGAELGYFAGEEDRENFRNELLWLQTNRKGAFNSPVQFNFGIHNEYRVSGNSSMNFIRDPETGEVTRVEGGEYAFPQGHACFIKGPRDSLESIAEHHAHETAVFSAGSGIGQDIGVLRHQGESLSGGGSSSGPMSFLKVYDAGAGTIKSGGKSRRAARLTSMRSEHPDVLEFIRSKVSEDKKGLILERAGIEGGMDGEAYTTVGLQNTNISVRADDYFFDQVKNGGDIELRSVKSGEVVSTVSADRIMKEIAFGNWRVGDPGMQYDDSIHKMHPAKNSGRQKSSNPCGEYLFLDDTSCNLASLNLLEFSDEKGKFDIEGFKRAGRIFLIAQDIANDAASYPVKDIAMISPEFRTTGLGYANLGAFLMRNGLAYDSDSGRALAASVTAILGGTAYETSAEISGALEPFIHYEFNEKPMGEVMEMHRKSLDDIDWDLVPEGFSDASYSSWDSAIKEIKKNGARNAQTTLLAPTGTIKYLMGCDTTGVEPEIALSIKKDLAGGGTITLANKGVANSLENLGYGPEESNEISNFIATNNHVIGAPHLNPDHYSVFATAFGNEDGIGSISLEGHVKMLGAVQPFLSGGISKTNNLPESSTVSEVYDAFILGHDLGLKGLTTFRTNSKPTAALNFGSKRVVELKRGEKEDLPERRIAIEFEVEIGGTPLHVVSSEYSDGRPGQITFLSYKAGSTLGSLLTTAGVAASKSLKRGVSLEDVTEGWLGHEFEPNGFVRGHPHIKTAKSPLDFAAKLLRLEYLGETDFATNPEEVNIESLRGFENGAFEAYESESRDDWDVDQVLDDPKLGGFSGSKKKNKSPKKKNSKAKNGNARGVLCGGCGNTMTQTNPNCFSCGNCGDKYGGCGQ